MSGHKPIRILASALTGRAYAVTAYDEKPDGRIVAKTKHDVSGDIESILAVERERIAQAIEATRDSRERMGVNPNNWGWQNTKQTFTEAARIARQLP